MTPPAISENRWEITVGEGISVSSHLTSSYVRMSVDGEVSVQDSPIQAVESGRASAVLDVRVDGSMRFASDGSWILWTKSDTGFARHAPDEVRLYENIQSELAVVVSRNFVSDTAWVECVLSEGVGESPAAIVRTSR